MAGEIATIALYDLRFGHECLQGDVNIRKPACDCAALADSIRKEGLLQPLAVWSPNAEAPYFVIAGGRRLMALRYIHEDDNPDFGVHCLIIAAESAADALAKSLVTEDTHLPPHPVDRFETFQRLAERGVDGDMIAARFFVDRKIVRQSLALGALAPEVRDAWRNGEIDQAAAQCFTLAENPKQQVKVLERLRKKHGTAVDPVDIDGDRTICDATTVRKQFTGSEAEANRLLRFVTRRAYVDAGGALSEDLFTESVVIHDFAKLKRLAEEKLEAEAARLRADGWSFVEVQATRRYSGSGGHIGAPKPAYTDEEKKRVAAIKKREDELRDDRAADSWTEETALRDEAAEIESAARLRAYTPAQKVKLGCVVSLNHAGDGISIDHGLMPPNVPGRSVSAPGDSRARGAGGRPPEPPLDHETARMIGAWRAAAAGETLQRDEDLALAVLLAHLQTGDGPLELEAGYNVEHVFIPRTDGFAKVLRELRKQKTATLLSLLVKAIGEEVGRDNLDDESFVAALDAKEHAKALARRFDAKLYFAGCSKAWLLQIIGETCYSLHVDCEAMSKHDLEAICLRDVVPLGWLPPELRTDLYKPRPSGLAKPGEPAEPAKKRGRPPGKAKPKPSAAAKRAAAKAFAP